MNFYHAIRHMSLFLISCLYYQSIFSCLSNCVRSTLWNVAGFRFTGADVHMAIEHGTLEKAREKELDRVYDLFVEEINAQPE